MSDLSGNTVHSPSEPYENNPEGKEPFADSAGFYYTIDVQANEIIANIRNVDGLEHLYLCQEGLFTPRYRKRCADKLGRPLTPIDTKKPLLKLLVPLIPLLFSPSERKSINSYEAKHMVEQLFHTGYVSNGEFILAMETYCSPSSADGFKRKEQGDSPNVVYYASISPLFESWVSYNSIEKSGHENGSTGHWKFPA
jgi:hypothetical protein